MKRYKKIAYIVLPIILLVIVLSNSVFATSEILSPTAPVHDSDTILGLTKPAGKVWKTVTVCIQVAGFAGIIFIGIRYMFASADNKADIKKELIYIIVGIVLIFGADIFVRIIYKLTDQIL